MCFTNLLAIFFIRCNIRLTAKGAQFCVFHLTKSQRNKGKEQSHMKAIKPIFVLIICLGVSVFAVSAQATDHLLVYAGSASQPPAEEAVKAFEEETGIRVDVVFGGSGTVLSQMKLAKQGDLYFPGSSDFMIKAKRDGDVFPETETIIVYLVSAINVQKGNPHNIHSLKDLTRPGLRVAIANPESVCVGTYAVEIVEQNFTPEEKAAFKANLANYTGSCSKTATAISLKQADAVIGWRVFEHWDPERLLRSWYFMAV